MGEITSRDDYGGTTKTLIFSEPITGDQVTIEEDDDQPGEFYLTSDCVAMTPERAMHMAEALIQWAKAQEGK